ncbi:MAG: hypothetical protein ACETVO_02505 [bacterium]
MPIVVVIGMRSVLYDAWRQMFFVYPAFLMLSLAGLASLFELDYWGLSYRKALEFILRTDRNRIIKVYVPNWPGKANLDILTSDGRNRLMYMENPKEAKYFLSNYRWHREEYPYREEYYSIKIDGAKIMVVYKMD